MNRLLYIILALCMAVSCKKPFMVYEGQDYVRFATDSAQFSFVEQPSTVEEDTISIPVQLIGKVSKIDRSLEVVVDDSTTAVEGQHYRLLRPVTLMADSNIAYVRVVLNRTDDLKTSAKHIWFSIRDSEELLKTTYVTNGRTSYKLRFSDRLEKPEWWDRVFGNGPTQTIPYPYSEVRYRQYIDAIGSSESPLAIPVQIPYVLYLLRMAVTTYNASHAEKLRDEHGLVTWPVRPDTDY